MGYSEKGDTLKKRTLWREILQKQRTFEKSFLEVLSDCIGSLMRYVPDLDEF